MATLYFCVFESVGATALGDPLQEGSIAIGGASAQSIAINGSGRKRRLVRCYADTDCFLTWGANPTAVNDGSDGRPLGADNPEYFNIEAEHLLAVIART